MRFLVVSRHFRSNVTTMVHGVFKRFQMLLEAIGEIAQIDLLYYVPPETDCSPAATAIFEKDVSNHLNVPIRLYLCPLAEKKGLFSKALGYAGGAFNMVRQPVYSGSAGALQIKALETCLSYQPDAVLVHRLGAMSPFFLTGKKLPPIFFDLDDVEHVAMRRKLRYFHTFASKLKNILVYPALCRGEKKAIHLAHRTFVCSDHDMNYLQERWGVGVPVVIKNSVVIPPAQEVTDRPTLLFLGSYSYPPNVDGANFLLQKIWPEVLEKIPEARLRIAGLHPERIHSYHKRIQGVEYTGFVEDLNPLYRETRVVCVPILSGSGTRVKILEAAAYGKPIVSTRIGTEGLNLEDGVEIIIRDDPQAFGSACVDLLLNHGKCVQIGNSGREAVMKKFDRNLVKEKIKDSILSVMRNK